MIKCQICRDYNIDEVYNGKIRSGTYDKSTNNEESICK